MKQLTTPRFRFICALATVLVFGGILPGTAGARSEVATPSTALAPTSTISGTVTDGSGTPIPWIGVGAGDYDSIVNCEGAAFWTGTGADGTYHLDVPAGTYLVFVNSHGDPGAYVPEAYADVNSWMDISAATPVTVTSGQTVTGVDFDLPAGFAVSGRLVDDQAQPVLGAGGNTRDPDQRIEFGCALGFGSSDADGTFQVTVPAGTYDLGFCKDSTCATVSRELHISDHTDLGDVLFAEVPEPPRVFDPQVLESGYQVETIVPGGPNTPSDVAVTSDGSIYLAAVRSWNVYRVESGGTLTSTAPVGVYTLDAGSDGNLYGYFMPGDPGSIYRITPQGNVTTIAHLPLTSCESTMAVAPNLELWIGYNDCGGTGSGDGTLYRVNQAGQVFAVATGLPFGINALDFDNGGQLYGAIDNQVYRVDTSDGSLTHFATLPGGSSSHGLVVAPDGFLYVSSQGDGGADRIYKVTPTGSASLLATLPAGCVQGLDRTPEGDLIATMRCTGALYRVHPDGTWDTLLPGNGMATPQAMAFNLAGSLLVNNDESGRIVRIAGARGEFFAEVASYIPPLGHLAFEPSGDFYFSEACPGFQPRLIKISSQGWATEVTRDLDFPSGLAFTPGGALYVVEYLSGQISSVSRDGAVTTFEDGLIRPQSMAADETGNLFVAGYEGPLNDPGNPAESPPTNRIWKVDAAGHRTLHAALRVQDLVFSPGGDLFVSGPVGRTSGVLRVAPDGSTTTFAHGFLSPVGLAFDLTGNLYVSDDWDNSIIRITGFQQGTIQGQVTDAETSQPLPGATLSVVTGYPVVLGAESIAAQDGSYSVLAAPRTYTVTALAPGYRPTSQQITVQTDVTVTVDLELIRWSDFAYLPLVFRNN